MDLALATKSGSYETGCTRKLGGSVRNFENRATEKPVLPMVHSFSLSFFQINPVKPLPQIFSPRNLSPPNARNVCAK